MQSEKCLANEIKYRNRDISSRENMAYFWQFRLDPSSDRWSSLSLDKY